MIKAVVIDDEINSRELLIHLIEHYCSGVKVLGEAAHVTAGIELIRETQPELVFLDVEMPGGVGFDIVKAFPNPGFEFIFVTGYHATSVRALQASALEYLEKPVDLEALQEVLSRIERPGVQLEDRMDNLAAERTLLEPAHLVLPEEKGYRRIALEDILYLKAEGGYVLFYFRDGSQLVASRTMSHFETLLVPPQFFRIHKSYLVNCAAVLGFDPGRGGEVSLEGGVRLPIAFRRKPAFVRLIRS